MKQHEAIGKQIEIEFCNAVGPEFENLTPGSKHVIIDAPADQKPHNDNGKTGYWVNGVTEPVLVLFQEMTWLSSDSLTEDPT